MIKIERAQVTGWAPAIRGMRNPLNSWDRSDTCFFDDSFTGWHDCLNMKNDISAMEQLGNNDHDLMKRLCKGGPVHAKFRRMIIVYVDIIAPLYWWKEADTYKVGTVCNSCSTMHKISEKEFELSDFSHEHLYFYGNEALDLGLEDGEEERFPESLDILEGTIRKLNFWRNKYIEYKTKPMKDNSKREELRKFLWWQMIQLLPTTYNQRRTMMLNYEVLANIYEYRQNHKLDEWRDFCKWIETLPYSEIITGKWDVEENEVKEDD